MTKEEAVTSILTSAKALGTWQKFEQQVRDIIDQIDLPAEFSVRELCELVAATHVNYPDQSVELFGDGSWIVGSCDGQAIDSLQAALQWVILSQC